MRVLLTGVAGFLGNHLAERLLDDGHEVIGVDNFITGRLVNLERLTGKPGFHFIKHDDAFRQPGIAAQISSLCPRHHAGEQRGNAPAA